MADKVKDEKKRLDISNTIASEFEMMFTEKQSKGSNHVTNQMLSKEERMAFCK